MNAEASDVFRRVGTVMVKVDKMIVAITQTKEDAVSLIFIPYFFFVCIKACYCSVGQRTYWFDRRKLACEQALTARSRVLARLASLAQIGELAHRLVES